MSELPAQPAPIQTIEILDERFSRPDNSGEPSGKDILDFAKAILFALLIFVVLVVIGSWLTVSLFPSCDQVNKTTATILDFTKTAVPSIATLVLGFYFGKKGT